MNEDRRPTRFGPPDNLEEVVVLAENALYDGIDNIDNVDDALDNINTRLSAVEGGSGGDGTLKILSIGNSFGENLFLYNVGYVLNNLNVSGVTVYHLMHGGSTPAQWWTKYRTDDKGTVEYCFGTHIAAMDSFAGNAATAYEALTAANWDIVILQQFHNGSPSYANLVPDLTHLVAHIRHDCANRHVRIGMQLEWPRSIAATGNGRSGPKGILGYEAICEEIKSALANGNIDFIIPSGTGVMNAAYNSDLNTLMPAGSSYASDKTAEANNTAHDENLLLLSQRDLQGNPDKLHLANGVGKYVIAGCFVEAVIRPWCGKSIVDSTYTVSAYSGDAGSIAVTSTNRGLCHAASLYAMANPFGHSDLNGKNF